MANYGKSKSSKTMPVPAKTKRRARANGKLSIASAKIVTGPGYQPLLSFTMNVTRRFAIRASASGKGVRLVAVK